MKEKIGEKTVLFIDGIRVWITPVVQYFAVRGARGEHRQMVYAASFGINLRRAMGQTIRLIRHFSRLWKPEELQIKIESEQTWSKRSDVKTRKEKIWYCCSLQIAKKKIFL